MRSRTSFFNRTIFLKTISRFWPLWGSYAGLWFVLLPVQLINHFQTGADSPLRIKSTILEMASEGSPVMAFVFAVLAAMAAFGWLYNNRSAAFMAALPVRRESMFLSSYLAGLAMLLAGNVFTFLMSWLILAVNGVSGALWLFQWLAAATLDILNFYGFAALCAMLTGSLIILPLVYAVLQFTAVAVENMVGYLASCLLYGVSSWGSSYVSWLSPIWARVTQVRCVMEEAYEISPGYQMLNESISGWGVILGYGALGLVLSLLALYLYKKRRMETASDAVAIEILKPTFRVCLAVGCALCAAVGGYYFVYTNSYVPGDWPRAVLMLALLLLGGSAGWFAADMLIYKSFAVFKRHLRGWGVLCACLILLTLGCEADILKQEKRVPDPEDFDVVYIHSAAASVYFTGEEGRTAVRALHESIIENKALHESAADIRSRTVTITYENKERSVLSRTYHLAATPDQAEDYTSDLRTLEAAFNLKESIARRKEVTVPVTERGISYAQVERMYYASADDGKYGDVLLSLTDAEAYELYTTCILPDIADGTLGRIWLVEDEDFARGIYNCRVSMEFSYRAPDGSTHGSYFYTVPTPESYRTNAWLSAHGVEPETYWEALERAGDTEIVMNSNNW